MNILSRIIGDRRGTTAIEYALIAAVVSMVSVMAVGEVGASVSNVLEKVDSAMTVR